MSFMRTLGTTGIEVSALGLGTVKFGRNTGVKYPTTFDLPSDDSIRKLLAQARELGINMIDTAPAYGSSEERLGQLLTNRPDWILVTKVGEEFNGTNSTFDFSAQHTRFSIERSLKRLHTDYLDLVLIHSDGNDDSILHESGCVDALRDCQQHGLVRAIGMSTKTEQGGMLAAELLDVVMLTWNLQQQELSPLPLGGCSSICRLPQCRTLLKYDGIDIKSKVFDGVNCIPTLYRLIKNCASITRSAVSQAW